MKTKFLFLSFSLIIIMILLSLGFWQLDRLSSKENLISQMKEGMNKTAVEFSHSNSDNFTRVKLSGEFIHKHVILVGPRYINKKQGYYIITPVKTDDSVILVNRGWAPEGYKSNLQEGKVHIEGVIRNNYKKASWFMPQNDTKNNKWFWIDLPEILLYLKNSAKLEVLPMLVQEISSRQQPPIAIEAKTNLPNDHLQYAVTWFSMAFVISIMSIFYFQRKQL